MPDDNTKEWWYHGAMREVLRLSLTSSNLNTALAPTRRAAEQAFLRIRLTSQIWTDILDELLSDDPHVESGHSTYFSVVCDFRYKPLLYYDGPAGNFLTTARGLCQKLQTFDKGLSTTEIVDAMGYTYDSLSVLVTTSREYPSEKVKDYQVEDVQLLSLSEASVRVIADTIIKENHPWNTDEVFDFYSLGFKPLPKPAQLLYASLSSRQVIM